MIVDDEVIIAETLRTIMMQHGYACFALYDAASAIELARVIPPDLLLTDFVLTGMSGLELAIQVAETCPACQIILFSAIVSKADMTMMCLPHHPEFALLEKPVHPDILLARIENMLQSAAAAIMPGPKNRLHLESSGTNR